MNQELAKASTATFETERLLLREIALTDAPAYQKYFNDYQVIS